MDEPQSVMVELPVEDTKFFENSYVARRVDVPLTRQQAVVLKRMLMGLQREGATFRNGSFIRNTRDVIRYMLEQAHHQLEDRV